MKILQLHARYRIAAGEDSVVENEASALRGAGHDVEQLIVPNPTSTGPAIAALARSPHNRHAAAAVRRVIARFRPEVVHVHNTWFALSSSAVDVAASSGVPVVMTLHNYRLGCIAADLFRGGAVCTACVGRSPVRGVVHACYRGSRTQSAIHAAEVAITRRRGVLDRSVARFVAPSTFMADRLVDIGVPEDRLVVKAHFVHDPGPRLAPPSESDEVLCVGRLAPGKGVDTLVAAWSLRDDPSSRLVVVGDGPDRDTLAATAGAGVELVGWSDRDEVTERLLRARALVMPSELYETFGMVLIEAMSAGLPVIATTVAAARSIVGPDGIIAVGPGDRVALAGAIDALDDDTTDRMGAANRMSYLDRYTPEVGVAALEALYDGVRSS
jgi:glycosyltransferase involved in cell wall biosynthesis